MYRRQQFTRGKVSLTLHFYAPPVVWKVAGKPWGLVTGAVRLTARVRIYCTRLYRFYTYNVRSTSQLFMYMDDTNLWWPAFLNESAVLCTCFDDDGAIDDRGERLRKREEERATKRANKRRKLGKKPLEVDRSGGHEGRVKKHANKRRLEVSSTVSGGGWHHTYSLSEVRICRSPTLYAQALRWSSTVPTCLSACVSKNRNQNQAEESLETFVNEKIDANLQQTVVGGATSKKRIEHAAE